MARRGELNAAPLRSVAGTLRWVLRLSAVALLLVGALITAARYTGGTLTGTTGGQLVVGMVVPWGVLAGTVEVGTGRLRDGTERDKVREPARGAWRLFLLAGAAAVLLLVVAGLLGARRMSPLSEAAEHTDEPGSHDSQSGQNCQDRAQPRVERTRWPDVTTQADDIGVAVRKEPREQAESSTAQAKQQYRNPSGGRPADERYRRGEQAEHDDSLRNEFEFARGDVVRGTAAERLTGDGYPREEVAPDQPRPAGDCRGPEARPEARQTDSAVSG